MYAFALLWLLFGTWLNASDAWIDRPLKPLTLQERRVLIDKATEPPFSGTYDHFDQSGLYTCKLCGAPLYRSKDKFDSGCGWPAFDDEIKGAIKRIPDGSRTEIVCARCNGHLGHVFEGEKLTPKNIRHCVNSLSLDFEPDDPKRAKAYFAGGCFWGMEYYFEREAGVWEVHSGYMGGSAQDATYPKVSTKQTDHVETIEVIYDPSRIDYERLARLFFELHDPTQVNRQGPDIGAQYRSVLFYNSEHERTVAERLITRLRQKGFNIATQLQAAQPFYRAESYHQDYYERKGTLPYCHGYVKRF